MVEKSYTPAELADADRLTKAIASVPEEKSPAVDCRETVNGGMEYGGEHRWR